MTGIPPGGPVIQIEDVARFYRVYDAAHGHPTAAELQRDYLDPGSPGLHHLAVIRNVSGVTIAKALAAHPQIFAQAKRCMAVLPRVRERVATALRTLGRLYPKSQFPPVTVAVSRGKPAGVADATGVIIGLEASCAADYLNPNVEDRFVHEIAHEYTHVQQALQSPALYNESKPTVLDASLIEGAAEFTATLITGEVAFHSPFAPSAETRDRAIEAQFVADEDKTDLSQWIDNGTLTEPGDLGYWVGYRIVRSYYEHAADKRAALRDILEMKDPKAFLARSGWHPAAAPDLSSPVGLWAPTDGKGKPLGLIRIFEQNGAFYGRIEPTSPSDDSTDRCTRCSGDRKDQPVIGLVIMRHLTLKDGEYVGGDILDPRSGWVYRCKFRMVEGGLKLRMRGYLGISLLGHTMTWVRVNPATMKPY